MQSNYQDTCKKGNIDLEGENGHDSGINSIIGNTTIDKKDFKLGVTTNKSEIVNGEISTVNIGVNNILSKEGIKYFFSSILSGFKNLDAIYIFIVAMIGIGFADASGLFKKALKNFKKFKLSFVIVLTLIGGCLLGGLGLNSYAFLLPLAGYVYVHWFNNGPSNWDNSNIFTTKFRTFN